MAASMWARKYTASGADVTLALGTDLDDSSVGPTPYVGLGGKLIHVDVDPSVFNRNVPTALGVHADLGHFVNDLYEVVLRSELRNPHGTALMAEVRSTSAYDEPDFESELSEPIAPQRAVADLQRAVSGDTRFITDIGEHMLFALHYLTADDPEAFHIQLNLGSMGSGIAGAIGLALGDESRPVVCICGDGGMQMAGMEILTAIKERLPIVYAVFNDGRYNMVHHGMKQIFSQAQQYDTPPVDFESWALAMGVAAATITRSGQIDAELLKRLRSKGGPVLLDIRIDAEQRIRGGGRVEALQHMSMLAQAAGEEL
jgi:acetolactate synthase-1/2/3 large subunit